MFTISEPDSGSSALYLWNESTDNWDARALTTGDALAGTVTVLASDNYGFSETSVVFLWALVASWILIVPTKRELRTTYWAAGVTDQTSARVGLGRPQPLYPAKDP